MPRLSDFPYSHDLAGSWLFLFPPFAESRCDGLVDGQCEAPFPPFLQPEGGRIVGCKVFVAAGCRVDAEVGADEGARLEQSGGGILLCVGLDIQPVRLYKFFRDDMADVNARFSWVMAAVKSTASVLMAGEPPSQHPS